MRRIALMVALLVAAAFATIAQAQDERPAAEPFTASWTITDAKDYVSDRIAFPEGRYTITITQESQGSLDVDLFDVKVGEIQPLYSGARNFEATATRFLDGDFIVIVDRTDGDDSVPWTLTITQDAAG